jgi:hypothetical protein
MKRTAMLLGIGVIISAMPSTAVTNPSMGKWCSARHGRTSTFTPRSIPAIMSSEPFRRLNWNCISPYWDCEQNLPICQLLAFRAATTRNHRQ